MSYKGSGRSPVPLTEDDIAAAGDLRYVRVIRMQKFIPGDTLYTPHAKMKFCIVEGWAGGGAGGGVPATGDSQLAVGGGGGAGAYFRKFYNRADLGATEAITVGAKGTGVSNASGNSGGNTTFKGCTANGGVGGPIGTATGSVGVPVSGASGGAATGGDENLSGEAGHNGIVSYPNWFFAGHGGSSPRGGAGAKISVNANTAGVSASGKGAAGSGASSNTGASARAGGDGGDGEIIITEFCSA